MALPLLISFGNHQVPKPLTVEEVDGTPHPIFRKLLQLTKFHRMGRFRPGVRSLDRRQLMSRGFTCSKKKYTEGDQPVDESKRNPTPRRQ